MNTNHTLRDTESSRGIEIRDLHLSFGETKVLQGVNLSIQPGEFFAFLGPSGSGKSTLLRAVAGFGPTPQGAIEIGGKDVIKLPPWERDVGMVFQSYALWPHMSVEKNVAFGLEERKIPAGEIKKRVMEALDLVGLADFAQRKPSALSGGQQQRVALARTIVIRPKVLLLDEPLSNLDANLRVRMRRDILKLQRQLALTTIFVTHDQEEANTTASRIAVLDKGIIQQVGSPTEIYDRPHNRFVAEFLGHANILAGTLSTQGDEFRFVSESGIRISVPSSAVNDATSSKQHLLVFRPQNVKFCPASEKQENAFSGVLEDEEFLGSSRRFSVNLGGETVLIEAAHHSTEEVPRVGEPVSIQLDPGSLLVLPDN